MIIPSRQDNLPNTGVEALACGTPVVAFNTCGLSDIVDHEITGYLAKAFSTDELADGIKYVIGSDNAYRLHKSSRKKAEDTFNSKLVAKQYSDLYNKVINR